MRKPKRECPICKAAVHVKQTITLNSTHRVQRTKCSTCGLTGSIAQSDTVTWDFTDVQPEPNRQ